MLIVGMFVLQLLIIEMLLIVLLVFKLLLVRLLVIGLLVIYMAFLSCLEPVLARRKMLPSHAPAASGYNEHHDEDDLEEDMQGVHCH